MLMPTNAHPSGPRPFRLLTFARARDAEICAVETRLTPDEAIRLRRTLDLLVELGALALYRLHTPLDVGPNWQSVIGSLRKQVGALVVDAATTAAVYPPTPVPKPQALIPLWPFERGGARAGALTAPGSYGGTPLVFEALPVEEHDFAKPLPAASNRLSSWQAAVGANVTLGTVTVPGHQGAYALFASSRAG